MSNIRILYLGDIMGRPGRHVITERLPLLRKEHAVDVVIAQAENVSHGKSMTPIHMRELQKVGVDAFSGGNHTIERPTLKPLLENAAEPVIAPINQEGVDEKWGAKIIETPKGEVLIASVLGTTFPKSLHVTNPLVAVDLLLEKHKKTNRVATIINFHGDFSSEKRVIGYYLDGRVSAVIGDHWHVPTADAMLLPKGTAHITDVGMCGTLHSSLGVSKEVIIARWRDAAKIKNDIAEEGPYQLNAVIVDVDCTTGLASSITQLQQII